MELAKDIAEVVARLNVAALRDEGWDEAMVKLGGLLAAEGTAFEQFNLRSGAARGHGYSGFSPKAFDQYTEHYHKVNKRIVLATAMPAGQFLLDDEVWSHSARDSDEFLNWLRTESEYLYCLGATVRHDRNFLTVVGFHRPDPSYAFTDEDMRRAMVIMPYLQVIDATVEELGRLRSSEGLNARAVEVSGYAVAYLDRAGRVTGTNAVMASMLAGGALATLTRSGRLRVAQRNRQARLDRAILCGVAGEIRSLVLHDSVGEPHVLRIVPLDADDPLRGAATDVAMLMIRRAAINLHDAALLQQAWGLTPREAEIALHIANGRSLEFIAREYFCTVATVRTHLKSVFGKTQISRQPELAARIFRLLG